MEDLNNSTRFSNIYFYTHTCMCPHICVYICTYNCMETVCNHVISSQTKNTQYFQIHMKQHYPNNWSPILPLIRNEFQRAGEHNKRMCTWKRDKYEQKKLGRATWKGDFEGWRKTPNGQQKKDILGEGMI